MDVVYDADGYEYPVDDYGPIYVPLRTEQTTVGQEQGENGKETKNWNDPMLAWPLLVLLFAHWCRITKKCKRLEGSCEVSP